MQCDLCLARRQQAERELVEVKAVTIPGHLFGKPGFTPAQSIGDILHAEDDGIMRWRGANLDGSGSRARDLLRWETPP